MKISTKQYIYSFYQACDDIEIQKILPETEIIYSNINEYKKLLSNPNISWLEKEKQIIKNKISVKLINFLRIISINQDIKKIPAILKSFIDLVNQKSNIEEVWITVSEKLNNVRRERLINELEKILDKKIILKEIINEKIIGGIIIQIGDKLYDNSIMSKLNKLKNNLIK